MASIRLTDRGVGAIKATGTERIELWDSELRGLYLRISSSSKIWGYRYRRLDGTAWMARTLASALATMCRLTKPMETNQP